MNSTALLNQSQQASDGLDIHVKHLDLQRLKHLHTDTPGAEMSITEWDTAELEYRRFLTLKRLYPGVTLIPTKAADSLWQAHILDTRAYRSDCHKVFSRFIDRYPYFGIYGEEDQREMESAKAHTARLHEKHFGAICGSA
ncbi:hypothetical protein [Halopseudomonas sp.]|uniref:glycine-rich domain-containing protein n=1 Tax=Halopseudomonas sp. TaxID=2901191 RepID=UPI00311DA0F7